LDRHSWTRPAATGRGLNGVSSGDEHSEHSAEAAREQLHHTHAAMMLGFAPAWALDDTSNLRSFPILAAIDVLTVCVDRDLNGAGQGAASECFDGWTSADREVWSGADMNDVVAGAK
jgi:hypothetical protein